MEEEETKGSVWRTIIIIALGILLYKIFFGSGLSGTRRKWIGVYYPTGCLACSDQWIFSPYYDSLEDCLDWVNFEHQIHNNNPKAQAECAYDCRHSSEVADDQLLCKETIDAL